MLYTDTSHLVELAIIKVPVSVSKHFIFRIMTRTKLSIVIVHPLNVSRGKGKRKKRREGRNNSDIMARFLMMEETRRDRKELSNSKGGQNVIILTTTRRMNPRNRNGGGVARGESNRKDPRNTVLTKGKGEKRENMYIHEDQHGWMTVVTLFSTACATDTRGDVDDDGCRSEDGRGGELQSAGTRQWKAGLARRESVRKKDGKMTSRLWLVKVYVLEMLAEE